MPPSLSPNSAVRRLHSSATSFDPCLLDDECPPKNDVVLLPGSSLNSVCPRQCDCVGWKHDSAGDPDECYAQSVNHEVNASMSVAISVQGSNFTSRKYRAAPG